MLPFQSWTRFVIVGLMLYSAWCPATDGQATPGPFTDVKQLPDTPAGQRVKELIDVINSGDRERVREFVGEALAPTFRDRVPLDEHLSTFADVHRSTGGVDFYSVRNYEKPSASTQLTAIVRARLSDSWLGFVVEIEPDPPHKIAGLRFAPARPPSDLPPPTPLNEQELVEQVRKFMDKLVAADAFSGAVLLAKDDRVLFEQAYGQADKSFEVPNKVDTKFNLGSMNKMFTATAVMQLVERGQMKLDDPLSTYLGADWLPPEIADKIKIEHLLTHTSGLGSYFNDKFMEASRARFRAVSDYRPLVVDDKPQFEPGTKWAYSNTGFLLLGAVIEKVTGGSYFDYIRKNIYEPAGMKNSDCYDLDRVVPNLAIGYSRVTTADGTFWENNLFKHVIRGGPAGGGFSTVGDLLKFSQAMRGSQLVNKDATARMWTATPQSGPGMGYGFGFGVFATPAGRVVGHSGGFPGINSVLQMYLDSGFTLAAMSNYDGGAQLVEQKVTELLARLK